MSSPNGIVFYLANVDRWINIYDLHEAPIRSNAEWSIDRLPEPSAESPQFQHLSHGVR